MSRFSTWFQSTPDLARSWLPPTELSQSSSPRARSPLIKKDVDTSLRPSRDGSDAVSILKRSEANIQKHLQRLLDAQAESLNKDLGTQGHSARSSDGFHSPGRLAPRQTKVMPVRQPRQQALSLRTARRGIREAMIELSALKDQELEIHDGEIMRCSQDLDQLEHWDRRRQALHKEIEDIRKSEPQERINSLRDDDLALQEQINAIEVQLARLKGQQDAIRAELSRVTNTVDSQISSYGQSLGLLDNQIKEFLRRPRNSTAQNKSTYLALPPERRTLEMAAEYMQDEKTRFEDRRISLAEEREAIAEGLAVWQDVVHAVTKFERSLRRDIDAFRDEDAHSGTSRSSSRSQSTEYRSMHDMIQQMEVVILDLDSKVRLAEARGWKLLVCCIGAELEAFQQGREVLQRTSNIAAATQVSTPEERSDYAPSEAHEIPSQSLHEETLFKSDATITTAGGTATKSPRAYRDEEPDPDLLVSRTDIDTDPE